MILFGKLRGSTPFDAKELMASGIDAMRKTIREKEPQRPSTRFATLGADQLTTTAKRRSADTSKLLHPFRRTASGLSRAVRNRWPNSS